MVNRVIHGSWVTAGTDAPGILEDVQSPIFRGRLRRERGDYTPPERRSDVPPAARRFTIYKLAARAREPADLNLGEKKRHLVFVRKYIIVYSIAYLQSPSKFSRDFRAEICKRRERRFMLKIFPIKYLTISLLHNYYCSNGWD